MPESRRRLRPLVYNHFDNEFDRARHLAFVRSRAQADYRGEIWELTYEDWSEFWPDPETFERRGRSSDSLCLTRYDEELPWTRSNTVQLSRRDCLTIKNRKRWSIECEENYSEARWL